jgi:hypothetical protein
MAIEFPVATSLFNKLEFNNPLIPLNFFLDLALLNISEFKSPKIINLFLVPSIPPLLPLSSYKVGSLFI